MSYEAAPSTALLDVHCACCHRPLRDALSVECGIGPDCREKYGYDADAPGRPAANALIHEAALRGTSPARLSAICAELRVLGFSGVAGIVEERFVRKFSEAPTVLLEEVGAWVGGANANASWLSVRTPYCAEFVADLKASVVPSARGWDRDAKVWMVAAEGKRGLLGALSRHFGGAAAVGPKGAFFVPEAK